MLDAVMSEPDQPERRRAERVPVNHELGEGLGEGGTWVSDLSSTGVFVHTDEPIPVGSIIDLRFTVLLDDPVVIEVQARVVRHGQDPRGLGVEFIEPSDDNRARIEAVLERRRPVDSGAPLDAGSAPAGAAQPLGAGSFYFRPPGESAANLPVRDDD